MIWYLFIIVITQAINIYIDSHAPYILKLSDYFNDALNYTTNQPIQQSLTMNLIEFQQQIVGIYQQSSELSILYNNNSQYQIALLQPDQNINLSGFNTVINMSQYNCNQFVGIQNQYIISCIDTNTNNLTYIYTNGTTISTEFVINSYKSNIFQLQYYEQELVAQQIFVMNNYTLIISLNNERNQINSQIIQGDYIQVLLGEDGTLFLLTQLKLLIQSNNNTIIQEFNNTSKGKFQLMEIYQIGKSFNITSAYSVVVATQFNLFQFSFDSKNNSKIISNTLQADKVKYLLLNSIYLVYITDIMIVVYDSNLKLINYMGINQPYLVQWNENEGVIQLIQQSSQNMFQSSIITIQILESIIFLEYPYPSLFTVQSGTNSIIFTPIVAQNNCPYGVQTLSQNNITYPNQTSIQISKMFVGPNITYSLSSNQSSSYLVSQQYSSQISNQKFIFEKYCNFPETYSSYTFIGQKSNLYFEITNGIQQYQHQSTSQIMDSECQIINNKLVISLQYLDWIQLLYLTPQLSLIQEQNYTFQNQTIMSSVIVYPASLFIIMDNQQLIGYNIKTDNQVLNITGVRNIFSNYLLYRGLIFIDQITQLLVFQYFTSTYYTQIQSFSYVYNNVTNIDLGLLSDGFYLSLQCIQNTSYLFYYPRQMLQQYSLGLTLVQQQINTYGEIFAQPFITTSTPSHYYVFTSIGQLMVFQQNYLPYNALYMSFNISNQISNISAYWNTQYDTVLLANYNLPSQQLTIFRIATATITPGLNNEEYTYIYVNYIASNSQCQTMINQTILYYNSGIQIQTINNNTTQYQMINQEDNLIQLDPAQYFVGTIQNYSITPDTVLYLNPITNATYFNIVTQAATQDNNGTLYLQNNVTLYKIYQFQLVKVYDFPLNLQYCFGLFIDLSTQFPVSFCQNMSDNINYFFAYDGFHILQSTINFTGLAEVYYKESILQIIYLKSRNSYNYISMYFWITNSIQYQYIYTTSLPESEVISPIYLQSDQKCQKFGISLQNFKLLISYQCYPLRSDNYTIIQTVQLPKQTNNLIPLSTAPLIQAGNSHPFYVIASCSMSPILLEIILTNSSQIQEVNQITTFYQQNFDINQNYNWYTVLAYEDLVININNILADTITIDVYANPFNHINQQIPIVGYSNISTNVTNFAQQLFDGFLVLTSPDWNKTILYKVQNTLDIIFDIIENFEMNIKAQNPYSQENIQITVLYTQNQKIYWWVYVVFILIIIFISVMLIWYCNKRKRDREARLAESDAMIEIKQRFSQSI